VGRSVEITFQPFERQSTVPAGTDLFTAAHWIGLPIASTCGGLGTCGLCKTKIIAGSLETTGADRELLSESELGDGWRLACRATAQTDTVCEIPEVLETPRMATSGLGREVAVEPDVHKVCVELDAPSAHDTSSDLSRLRKALAVAGHRFEIVPPALRSLARVARAEDGRLTATLCGEHLVALEPGDTSDRLFGVAFDVGTTTVVGTLLNLVSGEVEAVSAALNRQATFGGDVITRIAHTMADEDGLATLQRLALETLDNILADLYHQSGVPREEVYEALLVGNSTMVHLALGVDARSISVAPFIPVFEEPVELAATKMGLGIHPQGRVGTLPLIGAYVGADTVAGIHATDLARDDRVRLFIDVGTNSEIALGSSAGVVATSAPAGPAFEGAQIRHGMTATTGAIERVVMNETVEIEVIGGGEPRGICGSGLIDAVAGLRHAGLVDESGRMIDPDKVPDHPLRDRFGEVDGIRSFVLAGDIVLTQQDIRELQAAMSSVATGIRVLLESTGLAAGDLEEVMLAGSFGSSIDPESARVIGLVPPVPVEKIRFVGNVAAEGAKMSLLSFRERRVACDLKTRVEYVELSARPDFNDLFVAGVRFPELAAVS
jgi:uncharacterized 2Fe-2S/4Fe-4S cluster protein (DUF4445 family)